VDDNPMIGESMERWITEDPEMRWEGWHPDGAGVVDAVRRRGPAVVLMDVDIPGTDTFKLVREISTASPDTRVLMLSGHLRPDYVRNAIAAGAMGYMGKHRPLDVIADAVRRVAHGDFVLCDDAAAALSPN
jgi:two-component system response regulator DesR